MTAPVFSTGFQAKLDQLFVWRRDVRHFHPDPVPEATLDRLLQATTLAPSVGLSEPWRFVRVNSPVARAAIAGNFAATNARALEGYDADRATRYARLKLAGLAEAPHHIAVFSQGRPAQGHGLGRQTMPQTAQWSTLLAIHTFWLAATALGVGVGWISILDPVMAAATLDAEPDWEFVAYLCVGYPAMNADTPELEREGWERRDAARQRWIMR